MSKDISEKFINNLRKEISIKKDIDTKKRNQLQDSLHIITDIFKQNKSIKINGIRDFEMNEISCFVDFYTEFDTFELLSNIFEINNIEHKGLILGKYKCVFIIDLKNNILTSGSNINIFYIEIYPGINKKYQMKISHCDSEFQYSAFDINYQELKYWTFIDGVFNVNNIILNNIDRDNKDLEIKDDKNMHLIKIRLNDIGEPESFKLEKL